MSHRENILIRTSDEADLRALARLAALDSAAQIVGPALVAEVDGEMRAALPLQGGRAIADPFAESAHLVDLLRAHASAVRASAGERSRRAALAPAAA